MEKFPNKDTFLDFFTNKMKSYFVKEILPLKMIKDIFREEKALLDLKEVQWVGSIPRWKEFTAKYVWS